MIKESQVEILTEVQIKEEREGYYDQMKKERQGLIK